MERPGSQIVIFSTLTRRCIHVPFLLLPGHFISSVLSSGLYNHTTEDFREIQSEALQVCKMGWVGAVTFLSQFLIKINRSLGIIKGGEREKYNLTCFPAGLSLSSKPKLFEGKN